MCYNLFDIILGEYAMAKRVKIVIAEDDKEKDNRIKELIKRNENIQQKRKKVGAPFVYGAPRFFYRCLFGGIVIEVALDMHDGRSLVTRAGGQVAK